jgi:hypothetical protein
MADELKLKIILDDGSIKEGFLSIEKQSAKTADKIGKNFDNKNGGINALTQALESAQGGFSGLGQSALAAIGPYGALTAAVGASVLALGKMALAGEKVNAVNAQFANVATASGLAVDQFSESIIKATDGLIDDEDALQIATKGIIALGTEAAKIPEILDASRAVSRALGKDFKATFEDLSQFVETGNVRILRQYGIVLDLEQAYKRAAQSVGLTTAELTEQQKQTIRTNLALDEIPKKFAAAAQSVTPLADAFDRLKVRAANAIEALQSSLAEGLTKALIDESDLSNVSFDRLVKQLGENQKSIDAINARIESIKGEGLGAASVQNSARLAELNTQLKELKAENARLSVQGSGLSDQALFQGLDASRNAPAASSALKLNDEQQKLISERNRKNLADLQKFQAEQDKAITDSELKRIDKLRNFDQIETALKTNFIQQSITQEQQKNVALAQIEDQFSATKGFTSDQREQARLSVIAAFNQKELDLAQQQKDQLLAIETAKTSETSSLFSQFTTGYLEAAFEFQKGVSASFREVGKQAFNTLGRGIGNAFAAFGQALASGEDAAKAFLDSLIGVFADIAIQLGTSYILQGIAASVNPLTPGIGGPLIAAGAALATFGGLLKGLSGGKSSASTSAVSGGGIAAEPSNGSDLAPTSPAPQQPQTAVSVVVQGNVFDSQETGMRIVDLLNESFSTQGVVIQQGAMV